MNNLYYEFLALNSQLIVLDYALQTELFAIVPDRVDKKKWKIQRYVFLGQFEDSHNTWYILEYMTGNKKRRIYTLKNKRKWYRTMHDAKLNLWKQIAEGRM